jgi:hypothetical protein
MRNAHRLNGCAQGKRSSHLIKTGTPGMKLTAILASYLINVAATPQLNGTFDALCTIKLDNEEIFNGECSVFSDTEQTLLYSGNVISGKLAYISRNGQAEVAIKKVFLPQLMPRGNRPYDLIRGGNVVSTHTRSDQVVQTRD